MSKPRDVDVLVGGEWFTLDLDEVIAAQFAQVLAGEEPDDALNRALVKNWEDEHGDWLPVKNGSSVRKDAIVAIRSRDIEAPE